MAADLTQIATYLKDKFGPSIINQLPDETPIRSSFYADKSQTWAGNEVTYPVKVNRSRAVYAGADGGALPTASNQKHEKVHIPLKFIWGRVQFSGPAIKLSESNEAAFGRVMSIEMDGLVEDLGLTCEFFYSHFGVGTRALCNGNPDTGTVLTLDSPGGVAGETHGNRFLNEGDNIVAISPQGVLRAGGTRLINAIAADGTTVTVSAAMDTAWADNDLIVKAYGADASIAISNTEYMHAVMGLLGMVDDGTYVSNFHGISRDSYQIFRSPIISNVGALSLDAMQRPFDLTSQLGNAKISEMWAHHSTRRAYLKLLEADRRYTGGDLRSPDGGTKAVKGGDITYGDVPMKTAAYFPYGTITGVDNRHKVRYVNTEWEWIDEDGSTLSRVSNQDAFEASGRLFENAHYERPNAAFRMDSVNATVVVAHVM